MPVPVPPMHQNQATDDNALAVHRCRFVDYNPSAITAVAFPPLTLPIPRDLTSKQVSRRRRKGRFGTLAVGRANGNIELYEWAVPPDEQERNPKAPQAWVLSRILYGPNPSKVDSLVFTLRHPHLIMYNEVPSIEDLRLFSAGGGSELVEWDIGSGTILRTLNSQGGAIWSMAASPSSSQLALGCEDGCVRLVDVSCGELMHLRRFDRVNCRILSIAWGPPVPPVIKQKKKRNEEDADSDEDEDVEWTDSWFVTGGSDSSLRKWDVKTGRALDKMTTDKVRGERTLVWAVGVLADGTIISGDSLGTVKFWDSRSCTQLHSFTAHGADVLCMAIGPDGKSVFTSGVDQKVCLFTHVKFSDADKSGKKGGYRQSSRWVQSTSKRMHSHDVRALAVWPPYLPIGASAWLSTAMTPSPISGIAPILASGGLDASLVLAPCATAGSVNQMVVNPLATSAISTFEDAYHRRLAYPTGVSPAVSIARTARLIVCAHDMGVSVWRIIGHARVPTALELDLLAAQAMEVDSPLPESGVQKDECSYEKILEMELDTMTNICASAVSDDGRWLVVSDVYEMKLFELFADTNDGRIKPRRVKSFMSTLVSYLSSSSASIKEPEGASVLGFSPDGARLVLALARSARILVVDISGRSVDGRPEPRILRKFEHHARQGALFAHGRVVKDIPSRSNGISGVDDDITGSASDDDEDNAGNTKDKDVEMNAEDSVDKEKESADESEDEDEDEEQHVLVTRVAFSPDGQWFATTDDHYRTHIFNLDSVQHHTVLPTSSARVTALAFSPSTSHSPSAASPGGTLLILAHSDATIGVFDVEARQFAPWATHFSQRDHLPRRWTSLHDGVLGIAAEPSISHPTRLPAQASSATASAGGRHALFWGATWLCRIALDAPVGWGGFVGKRRRDGPSAAAASKPKVDVKGRSNITASEPNSRAAQDVDGEDEDDEMTNFKLVNRYRPILRAEFLDAGELLVVERPLIDVLRGSPPAFFKPKYGT